MTGKDCNGYPIRIGDRVEWVYDLEDPPQIRTVLGYVEGSSSHHSDGGYFQISNQGRSSVHRRFGVNLRVLWDPDLIMDEGL